MTSRAFVSLCALNSIVCLTFLSTPGPVNAQSTFGISASDLSTLDPYIRFGIAGIVEFVPPGDVPHVAIIGDVARNARQTALLLTDIGELPRTLPAMSSVSNIQAVGQTSTFDWAFTVGPVDLRGQSTLTPFIGPPERTSAAHRIVLEYTAGDLGLGRVLYRIIPTGTDTCRVVIVGRIDISDANYVSRELSTGGRTVQRSLQMALFTSMLIHLRERAEGAARSLSGAAPPSVDTVSPALEELLLRGDVFAIDATSQGMGQVVSFGRIHIGETEVRAAIHDPIGLTNGMLSGARVGLRHEDEMRTEFNWNIDVPLVGTSGVMEMVHSDDGMSNLRAVEGALRGAVWSFETRPRPYGTLVYTQGAFDLRRGLWLVSVVSDMDGSFRPGLSASAQMMMVKGLRARLTP